MQLRVKTKNFRKKFWVPAEDGGTICRAVSPRQNPAEFEGVVWDYRPNGGGRRIWLFMQPAVFVEYRKNLEKVFA
jgi:hypothetical protein